MSNVEQGVKPAHRTELFERNHLSIILEKVGEVHLERDTARGNKRGRISSCSCTIEEVIALIDVR
jgi:hypothetical protein